MKSSFIVRMRWLLVFIFFFSFILILKVFFLQIIHGTYYKDAAYRQYATPAGNIFERGTIYFTSKTGDLVSAATQTTGFKIAINPSKLKDLEGIYKKLSNIITLSHNDFIAKASKKDDPYEEVANRLTQKQADAVSALKIPDLNIFKEKWRFYPGGSLASNALGLVGYKGNDLGGRYGLESEYNTVLARTDDSPNVNFFAEVFSNINKTFFESNTKEGDIVTTIEPDVQSFLEKKLAEVKNQYNPDSLGGIIMNPTDGSIYALGVEPNFDPNNFANVKDPSVFSDPLVENVLEFGSVVKPLNMSAALDLGVVSPTTTYDDKGSVTVDGKEIFNFDKKGRGPGTTMQDVLNQSLNTGMVFVEEKLGRQNLKNYLLAFGIKDKTGVDLPNETSGLVSNLNSPREIEYANASFGQGIAMTPMEMTRALASLANGGNLVVPHLIDKIKYTDGTFKNISYPTTPTKISKKTADEITSMMVTVDDKGIKAGLPNFSTAVKTGTAQVADSATGGYYTDRHTHSFVGFFPAYNPKFIVFLYAVNPKGVQYSATTWTAPFVDIEKFLLNYYEVPPDR